MTNEQKDIIIKMKKQQMPYALISQELGIPVNTIKTFCRRNGLSVERKKGKPKCKQCGKEIEIVHGRKPRIFCSDYCKQNWWNNHRHERVSKSIVSYVCLTCGKTFNDYIGANRKYCSQACYRGGKKHDGE